MNFEFGVHSEFKPDIRALSWIQPYGAMMLFGKIETRTWNTKYRGWVLLCASKKVYSHDQVLSISGEKNTDIITRNWIDSGFAGNTKSGMAFAIGNLVDCRPMQKEDEEKCMVMYRPGLWCHVYDQVEQIVPFEWKGSQGWKILDENQKSLIHPLFP